MILYLLLLAMKLSANCSAEFAGSFEGKLCVKRNSSNHWVVGGKNKYSK